MIPSFSKCITRTSYLKPVLISQYFTHTSKRNMAWTFTGNNNDDLITNLKNIDIVTSSEVEAAMRRVDRKNYVPSSYKDNAYFDCPLPIGYNVTISAPHMHGHCLELLKPHLSSGSVALDVGSGSGYLTACMRELVGRQGKVYGVEHIQELVDVSIDNIKRDKKQQYLDDKSIVICQGDGRKGFPNTPDNFFDCIHVGAAADGVPSELVRQLKVGGTLVLPLGRKDGDQALGKCVLL
jgi:protein-L-isoaspartate(D-aspartate) O-methyltransferase